MRITPHELITLAVAGFGGRWLWHALFHPFRPCGRCGGTGKNGGSTGRRWGRCWRCGGSGSFQTIGSKQVRKLLRIRRGLADKKGK